jgi:hypothetical protein
MNVQTKVLLALCVAMLGMARAANVPTLLEMIRQTYPKTKPQKTVSVQTPKWFVDLKPDPSSNVQAYIKKQNLKFTCTTARKIEWLSVNKSEDALYKDIGSQLSHLIDSLGNERTFTKDAHDGGFLYYGYFLIDNATLRTDSKTIFDAKFENGKLSVKTPQKSKPYSVLAKYYIESKGKNVSIYLCEAKKPSLEF